MKTVSEIFDDAFISTPTKVAYSEEWENGTGYFDYAVKANIGLRPGDMAVSEDPKGRRIILVGTCAGNVVVFERFSPKNGVRSSTYASNVPQAVRRMYGDCTRIGTSLDDVSMLVLVGDVLSPNIGVRMDVPNKYSA